MNSHSKAKSILVVMLIAVAAGGAAWLARGSHPRDDAMELTTQAVERHDIALTVEATGTVEPVDLVEVKSKASGTIVTMPVSVGSRVGAGDLLVQIDARDVRNQYDQAQAARQAAQVKVEVSGAQKARADSLYAQGVITAGEHETALLDYASAVSSMIAARTNLDLAKQRLDDATVRAPGDGTVLSQSVTEGQVISSATSSVSGGTALLTMADLSRIRMRALVAEADIGNVSPGQRAAVVVDAFSGRTFDGTVEKIEPQAVVQQSVTNFPVLITLTNEDGLLLPGMNGQVTLEVDRQSDVLAVPVDAVRPQREALVIAAALGLDPDSVKARLDSQKAAARAQGGGDPGDSLSSGHAKDAAGDPAGDPGGKKSKKHKKHDSGSKDASASTDKPSGGSGKSQVVFVKSGIGIEPRRVKLGLSDFDFSQVISGVEEGEQVVMLGVAQAQADRFKQQAKARERAASRSALGAASDGKSGGS